MHSSAHNLVPAYAVVILENGFWIHHRGKGYGPFDYQFSNDLGGIEFLFQADKYGEFCSSEEFFADLKPYGLPIRVSEVAAVVTGTLARCIFQGIAASDRSRLVTRQLEKLGLGRYQLTSPKS